MFKIGDGSINSYLEIASILEKKYEINYMCTDEYAAYCYYKIAKHHLRTKSETCLVESFNSSLRDMLARLNRKTKRFSKCSEMLRVSVLMFYHKNLAYTIFP